MEKKNNMDKLPAAVIYVDFDDTLYCHHIHWSYEEDLHYNILFGFNQTPLEARYLNKELINKLYNIKKEYATRGLQAYIYMLSGCRTSVFFEAKVNLLKANCPDLFDGYYSVCEPKDKVEMIEAVNNNLMTTENVNVIDTLMIDDNFFVCSNCQSIGYDAATPVYFEKHYEPVNPGNL